MTDNQLIKLVAEIWTQNGGDAEGLDWKYKDLRNAIDDLHKQEEDTAQPLFEAMGFETKIQIPSIKWRE